MEYYNLAFTLILIAYWLEYYDYRALGCMFTISGCLTVIIPNVMKLIG